MEKESFDRSHTQFWIPFVIALAMAVGMFIGKKLEPVGSDNVVAASNIPNRQPGKVEEILRYINARYVDDVDDNELSEEAIKAIMDDLDPHSSYHSAEELRRMSENLRGNFEGIGVEFMIIEDTVFVVRVMEEGPSEALGVQVLDRIVAVNDNTIAGMGIDSDSVIALLKGPQGTNVDVTILREGETLELTINRGKIPTTSVDASIMIDDQVGYIKLDGFSATTYTDFMKRMEVLIEDNGMKDLVIDLRSNPGGYLNQAIKILDQFFTEKDKVLVYTQGDKSKKFEYKTTGRNFFDVGDIVVLIDENSASASEIIAGALQDWDRGKIIGRRSYGKGLVQERYPLKDGSAISLTISRYFTPSGRCIQKDYDNPIDYSKELYDRFHNGEYYTRDSIYMADTTKYFTSQGRVVYAGGGISPDIFVPLDTAQFTDVFYAMRGAINTDVIRYFEEHPELGKLTLEQFIKQVNIDDQRLKSLYEELPRNGLTSTFSESRDAIEYYYQARLARQLFGDNGFYTIWITKDDALKVALEALN
ncbi:MAG: S41 family peptidase [Bacteroidia bacterium]|nr:S41 family peptidase [Bacteroidia bacterium]